MDLATITDAIAAPRETLRVPLEGATAIHTPAERGYHFGNMLLLDAPPAPAALPRWLEVWDRELGRVPEVGKVVLQWEAPEPAPKPLGAAAREHRLELETDEVLVLGRPADGVRHPDARPITSDAEWDAIARLIADGSEPLGFVRWRAAEHRALAEAGRGEWWAVFDGPDPIAGAGIFWADGLVRFQEVATRASHRRRGLASSLLLRMIDEHAHRGRVVIVASEGGDGARLYRRLGFQPVGVQQALVGPRRP